MDYAEQILAEELCKDPSRKRSTGKRSRKNNHLLDCECLAAACADSEWLPSLKMLASYLKEKNSPPAQAKAKRRRHKWWELKPEGKMKEKIFTLKAAAELLGCSVRSNIPPD